MMGYWFSYQLIIQRNNGGLGVLKALNGCLNIVAPLTFIFETILLGNAFASLEEN